MATIQQIAKKAGVSVATVSHVVNRTRYVSPELVKKVESVINSLDDLPNFIAKKRNLDERHSEKYIIVFYTNINNNFQSDVIKSLGELLSHHKNTNLITVRTNDIYKTLENYSRLDNDHFIGQIILIDGNNNSTLKFHTSIKTIPTVLISEGENGAIETISDDNHVVISDVYNGSYSAVKHLINNGHEKIAIINNYSVNNINYIQNSNLLSGYKDALTDNNITINEEYIIGELLEGSQVIKTFQSLFYRADPPTALYVTNESALMDVLKFMNSNNLTCPEDLSIISFNDVNWLELLSPSITSVKQDTDYIAEKTLEIIERKLSFQNGELEQIKNPLAVPTKLQIRSSTGGIGRGPFGEKASSVDAISLSPREKAIINEKKYTAVISFHYTGAAWMHLHEQGIRDVFNELGISLLAVTDAHFDPDMQNKQLEGLMGLEPDIVIAIPSENNKTADTFKKIAKSSAKLVLITNVPNGLTPADYVSCVSVNEWSHGRLAGSGFGNSMRKYGKKNIGLISFDSDFYATNQRDAAARQILLEEYTELEIIGEAQFKHEEEAFEKTIKLLEEHPEIEGLYISWEGPAIKSLEALKKLGREDVIIGTADLDYSLALNMANEKNIMEVSAQLPYDQGQALALVAANALLDKDVPKFIGVEPIKVTRKNLIKNWREIFKENAPQQIVDAIKNKP